MLHKLTHPKLEAYLAQVLGKPVQVIAIRRLGKPSGAEDEKTYGYGVPIAIDYDCDGRRQTTVLHTMKPNRFGHEHMADRAAILLWSHEAFNQLPRHVRSLNVGAFDRSGELIALNEVDELFLLTQFVEGSEYAHDLQRLRDGGTLTPLDVQRADALCDYLVEIHQRKRGDAGLYFRRIRDLIGHGECIMGLIDSYPPHSFITPALLQSIEERAMRWRWKIRNRTHRLAQVHGDFHPWNVLFADGAAFHVLDRSRGQWGDPADDVACLTINYVFESVQRSGKLEGAFAELFDRFWARYLHGSGDQEVLEVIAPFIAWRGLVIASPVWYPSLCDDHRRKLFNLIEAVLDAPRFEPDRINDYLERKI